MEFAQQIQHGLKSRLRTPRQCLCDLFQVYNRESTENIILMLSDQVGNLSELKFSALLNI